MNYFCTFETVVCLSCIMLSNSYFLVGVAIIAQLIVSIRDRYPLERMLYYFVGYCLAHRLKIAAHTFLIDDHLFSNSIQMFGCVLWSYFTLYNMYFFTDVISDKNIWMANVFIVMTASIILFGECGFNIMWCFLFTGMRVLFRLTDDAKFYSPIWWHHFSLAVIAVLLSFNQILSSVIMSDVLLGETLRHTTRSQKMALIVFIVACVTYKYGPDGNKQLFGMVWIVSFLPFLFNLIPHNPLNL